MRALLLNLIVPSTLFEGNVMTFDFRHLLRDSVGFRSCQGSADGT
jgi:hypothetical protein